MYAGLASARYCAAAIALIALLGATSAHAAADIPAASRVAWRALLHYRSDGGAWVSEVRDRSFFLDEKGRSAPDREWRAARDAFLRPAGDAPSPAHAQCRFPARFHLMRQAIGWSDGDIPVARCPGVRAFERRLEATSLSAVFVSHYLNNPASAFGHAMLYLGSADDSRAVLADHSVSFEADVEGMAPVGYIPRGLLGGLVAGFRVARLHERVRKYERQEQRDLWLFPLDVSRDELDQLVRHLWELKDLSFEYGFFGGNCAQKLLAVVHAVAPQHGLLPMSGVAVLPSEVVQRMVERVGTTREPIYRPSLWSRYAEQVGRLPGAERKQHERMIATKTVVAGASGAALSATLLWTELRTPFRAFRRAADNGAHPDLAWRRALWRARVAATDDVPSSVARASWPAGHSILDSHGPSRATLRGGYRRGHGAVVGVGARWLLHDALDPPDGYPPVSSLEVARIDVGLTATGDVVLDELIALRIQRFAPASSLQSSLAWKIDVGARRLPFAGEHLLDVGAEVGVGLGAAALRRNWSIAVYSMLGARPGAAVASDGTSLLAAGLWSGGLLVRLPGDIRAHVFGEYAVSVTSFDGGAAGMRAVVRKGLAQHWDLELAGTIAPGGSGATLGLAVFR